MRRAAIIPGDPVTTFFFLEEDPDSLGCVLLVQQTGSEGQLVDAWERFYARVDAALDELERDWGIGPGDWLPLD